MIHKVKSLKLKFFYGISLFFYSLFCIILFKIFGKIAIGLAFAGIFFFLELMKKFENKNKDKSVEKNKVEKNKIIPMTGAGMMIGPGIGVAIGIVIGAIIKNMNVGIGMGFAIGFAIGFGLEHQIKSEFNKIKSNLNQP